MRVFVTGATGFIGSAVVRELLSTGHQVLGLARSEQGAESLKAAGAEVVRGDLDHLDSFRRGAAASDGVIHTAYIHDWSVSREDAAKIDRRAIEAMGEALAGTDRPFVITSGTGGLSPGRVATEESVPPSESLGGGRYANELAAVSFTTRGVRASVVRFPPTVHGRGDHGFIAILINIARTKGVSAYPGDGSNRWPAVHRLDAAHLFRLAVESAPAGARLHGVGEEGIPVREIAEVIGRHLNVPVRSIPREEANLHFGFLGAFFSLDAPASSTLTQQLLGWHPAQPGLIADLEEGHYFEQRGDGQNSMATTTRAVAS
jgi:nucleoside-diphosphate-sugar epimerase